MSRVLIVGAGAAGMYAAVWAARNGQEVRVFEKNEKAGKKLFITGKGRCNLTNACDVEDLFEAARSNPKFLYSSFYTHTNQDVIDFFEELGMKTKTERGGRVFPASDHSSDVIRTLEQEMKRLKVELRLNCRVEKICQENGKFTGVLLADGTMETGDACIVATGGMSYPSTGASGDGYRFAGEMGHAITELKPSLVPIQTEEEWVPQLMGLSLRNVELKVLDGKRQLFCEMGEMLFTHYGVSGPLVISASADVGARLEQRKLKLSVDLKPALSEERLDQRILRDFQEQKNKQFKNSLGKLLPSKLIPVIVKLSEIPPEKKINEISREERGRLVYLIKHLEMTAVNLRGWNEAIITKGGVSVREIDPGTMESRKIKNLYFVGEVLDLDAVTGGFNLQIAWSTAYAAASNLENKYTDRRE